MPLMLLSANILMFLTFLFKSGTLPPQIPLFYSRPQGEFQLTEWWYIFLIPVLMNGLFFLNTFLYAKFFEGNDFVKIFIRYFKIFLIVSFSLIYLKIIFLIT